VTEVDGAAELLHRCYGAAVAAVQPAAALQVPLRAAPAGPAPCWLIGVGKAAHGMTAAITDWLAETKRQPAGGIVVSPSRESGAILESGSATARRSGDMAGEAPHASLRIFVGDHPIPRDNSARAAAAIGDVVREIPRHADVHVAISGGASALIAGPLAGLTMADVTSTFQLLLTSGLDIHEMNAVRKRITRWSAGRLALALADRRVHVWVVSDVPGDDLSSIASGPCTGDPWTTDAVRRLLTKSGLIERLPSLVQAALAHETPKPTDPALAAISPRIVANNRTALTAAADMARRSGVAAEVMRDPLVGEAAAMGRRIADAMRKAAGSLPQVLLWGGETTVTITGGHGRGGRSQELAMAAAQVLHDTQTGGVLLAAGTDGRDGPTDAAGALVSRHTWQQVTDAGRDPAADLSHHDVYPALDAAHALVRTGPTGTNVMDLAIAVTGVR
jgi:glycerate 2-kinase